MGRGEGCENKGPQKPEELLFGPRRQGPGPAELPPEPEVPPVVSNPNLPPLHEELKEARDALPLQEMRAGGIETITLRYDGYGDSGEINDIDWTPREGQMVEDTDPLYDFAYRLLEHQHGGWEINEGSEGSVTIDLVNGSVNIDHHVRFIETQQHESDLAL